MQTQCLASAFEEEQIQSYNQITKTHCIEFGSRPWKEFYKPKRAICTVYLVLNLLFSNKRTNSGQHTSNKCWLIAVKDVHWIC